MAENKTEAPKAPVAPQTRNASAREVLAARVKTAQDTGILTPKLQRQFDRAAAKILEENK